MKPSGPGLLFVGRFFIDSVFLLNWPVQVISF